MSLPDAILVVDDDASSRYALSRVFQSNFRVVQAESVAQAQERLRSDRPRIVLLDYNMPGEDELVLLDEMKDDAAAPAVIMIIAHGSERLAVEAMKLGAYHYLAKPYELDELRLVVDRTLERQGLGREIHGLRDQLVSEGQFGPMVGSSLVMRERFQTGERAVQSDLPILLLGESGTEKGALVQQTQARRPRSAKPFVALNFTGRPETVVESEVFGYQKGTFTGAVNARAGKFAQAHGGIVFLDGIGDIDPATQARIGRTVETGAVERLRGAEAG